MAAKSDTRMKCIQYLLLIISFMFAIGGTLLITSAAVVLIAYRDYAIFVESHLFRPTEIVMGIGAIILLVSLFGGIAAIKRSTLCVKLYSLFLLALIILEFCAVITAFIMSGSIYSSIEKNMFDSLLNYTTSYDAKSSWDYMQQRLDCCGVYQPNNWAVVHVNGHEIHDSGYNYTVPYSCCKTWPCHEINDWTCLSMLTSYLSDVGFILIYTIASIELAQIVGLILSCMLTNTIRLIKTQEEMQRQLAQHLFYTRIVNEQQQKASLLTLDTPSSTNA